MKPHKKNKVKDKFQFTLELQQEILKYTVTDSQGYKALELYEDYYFDTIELQSIASVLKQYYKRKKRIASKVIFKEELRKFYETKEARDAIRKEDKARIEKIVNKIYMGFVREGDTILEEVVKFAQFVNLKANVEEVNLNDFSQHENFVKKIQKSISIGALGKEHIGTFLVRDAKKRLHERHSRESSLPMPFWQLNTLTNGGGYGRNSLFVILDKAKGFKTGFLANIARGYMRMRKRVIIFDLENGEENISLRFEQALLKKNKKEILSGDHDKAILKILRRYARLNVEVIIKRLPAGSTSRDLEYWLDFYYKEFGLRFEEMIIDYIGLMGSITKVEDDNHRISNAYIEVKNVAEKYNIEHTWTGHHIVRNAHQRRAKKYLPEDTAKCIDIHRHVEAMYGIQQDDSEAEGNVVRLEVLDQRDGPPSGAMFFFINEQVQRLEEFNKKSVEEYIKVREQIVEQDEVREESKNSKSNWSKPKSKDL